MTGDLYVWVAVPGTIVSPVLLSAYDELLNATEKERQVRLLFERNRRESLVSRVLVRTVLSRYRNVRPEDWRFRVNDWGKPEIDPPCGLSFNLSHHPSLVACVVSQSKDVGIDLEPISRGSEVITIADTTFSRGELAVLAGQAGSDRLRKAVALWTMKEAYAKACGLGMSLPFDTFSVEGDDQSELRACEKETIDGRRRRQMTWLCASTIVYGHRLSVAVRETSVRPCVSIQAVMPLVVGSERLIPVQIDWYRYVGVN